ncbi:MAG: hypothetical protein QW502_03325 [Candidatus Bathyarchaeia archaeon]|nr:hypothetical protein [Candidatus Bathyarchaeota archaeon]
MRQQIEKIIEIFNQAWLELYCPPVRLIIEDERGKSGSRALFSAINGEARVRLNVIPKGCDPYKYLLWHFRHELAHAHYCPYDLRTAYSLEKAAYSVVGDWDIAYLATHLFADLQININYLPRRFGEIPYFMRILRGEYPSLLERLLHEIYLYINPIVKPSNNILGDISKEILAVTLLDRPWHTKVQMIAIILTKLKVRHPRLFSKREIEKYLRDNPIPVREDLMPDSMRSLEEVFGGISSSSDAEKFFKQWIEPRLPPEEKEKITKIIKERMRVLKSTSKVKGEETGKLREKKLGGGRLEDKMRSVEKPGIYDRLMGEEPLLPSSLSKPYEKIPSSILNEAFWKRYWYRSRAERTLMRYLSENPTRRPVWAVVKYPDDWYIEDEIEDLDIDVSLDEGPLIPEVTTLKWIEEPTFYGQSLVTGFVPSEITVLDASLSMQNIHDEAAIAAFIAYLSAHKAGGQTAAITFSTGYVSAGWSDPSDVKELTLSMKFDEYTVFPIYEVKRLISERPENCFIVTITDGGWQNIDEAIPMLERIADSGHKIAIFLLPGGEYPERIKLIKRSPYLKVYEVKRPEADLQCMVLSESIRTYRTFLT